MSGEVDYEALPEGASTGATLIAGASAGVAEHCIMYPVDVVKTRMQALACNTPKFQSKSISRNILFMMREEGFWRPVQGVQAMALGAGPAHAMYFLSYETMKERLAPKFKQVGAPEFTLHLLAGCGATFFHDSVMCPAEVIKQRMQMCCSPFKNATSAFRTIWREEGLRAFYRSFPTSLVHNMPFQAFHFATYEAAMHWLNPEKSYNPYHHALAGAAAGGVGATVALPLDACKTLLNTQEVNVLKQLNVSSVIGLRGAWTTIYRMAGVRGFYQGLRARICFVMPGTAISWSTYEAFKYYLSPASPPPASEDTLSDLQRSSSSSSRGESSSRGRGDRGCEGGSSWESVVTDLPLREPSLPMGELVTREQSRTLLYRDHRD
jgi:solute carrier family 25 iron transporter 28/37